MVLCEDRWSAAIPPPWGDQMTLRMAECKGRQQGLALSFRLECSGAVIAHCSLDLLSSSNPPSSATCISGIPVHVTTVGFLMFFCRDGISLCCPGWLQTSEIKQSSCLSPLNCWDYRYEAPYPDSSVFTLGALSQDCAVSDCTITPEPGACLVFPSLPETCPCPPGPLELQQVGVQWRNLISLQLLPPGLKRSFHLSLLSSCNYRYAPLYQANCNGMISADCTLHLPGSSDPPASAPLAAGIIGSHHDVRLIFAFSIETGFRHVGKAGLEFLTSGDPSISASQNVGIIGVSH
ncbi:hypothetical protein AAY473_021701 [Plecturocebus cupreus]